VIFLLILKNEELLFEQKMVDVVDEFMHILLCIENEVKMVDQF